MKTTLDLPDDLLIEAKTLAVRRRITLKALVESALGDAGHQHEAAAIDQNIDASLVPGGPAAYYPIPTP